MRGSQEVLGRRKSSWDCSDHPSLITHALRYLGDSAMAGYKGHLTGGLVLYFVVIAYILLWSTGRIEVSLPESLTPFLRQIVPSDPQTLIYSLISLIFGSLAPDLDSHASKIRGGVTTLAVLLLFVVIVLPLLGIEIVSMDEKVLAFTLIVLIFAIAPRFFSHRSVWHWFLGLIVGIWGILLISNHYSTPFIPLVSAYMIGYFSHLFLDLL